MCDELVYPIAKSEKTGIQNTACLDAITLLLEENSSIQDEFCGT